MTDPTKPRFSKWMLIGFLIMGIASFAGLGALMQGQEIAKFLGSATVFGAVIAFLGKAWIDAFISGRLEAYKADLQRATAEHSVKFQSLHSERAEVIKEFYAKVARLDDILYSTLRSFQLVAEPSLVAKVSKLSEQFNEIRDYFLTRRIFFDEPLCKVIDSTLEIAKGIFYDITTYEVDPKNEKYQFNREVLKERHEFWEKARATHKAEFAQVKAKLEEQFRAILGIVA